MDRARDPTWKRRRNGRKFYADWCRENGEPSLDPDLFWLEEAWCLVRDRGLLKDKDPRDPAVLAHWARMRAILGALRG